MELAKWTFPIIVSFSREPYEVESLTYGSNGGHEETYRKATRLVPTQWKRTVRQRALYLPSDTYRGPTHRPSKDHKDLDERTPEHPSGLLTPREALDADCVDARPLLKVPPSAPLLTTCAHKPAGCGPVFAEPVPFVGSDCARG